VVVGTSAGSVVGALYAAGNTGFQLQKMAMEMDEAQISDWALPLFRKSTGVLKGEALQAYINKLVNNQPMEKLKIPFGAVAADLKDGKPILFQRGNTGMAVRLVGGAGRVPAGDDQRPHLCRRRPGSAGAGALARDMGADFRHRGEHLDPGRCASHRQLAGRDHADLLHHGPAHQRI
jgi:NTE family protein